MPTVHARGTQSGLRRAAILGIAVALLAPLPPGASADTETRLEDATARLETLEARIVATEQDVERLEDELAELGERIFAQERAYTETRGRLRRTQRHLEATREDLTERRRHLHGRARAIYIHGPLRWLDIALGSESVGEFTSRIHQASRILDEDRQALDGLDRLARSLESREAEHDALLVERAAALRRVERERRRSREVFAEHQERLAELNRARRETLDLVEELRDELRAERVARALRTAGQGMPLSYEEWAEALLGRLDAPVSRNNLVALIAWQTAEGTRASWNPLATTYRIPGTTVMNDHGVRNYRSKEEGIEATVRTLAIPGRGYGAILDALRRDAPPMETARAINASHWCRECTNGMYVIKLIDAVAAYYPERA